MDYIFEITQRGRGCAPVDGKPVRLGQVCYECLSDGLRLIKPSSGNYKAVGSNLERVGK